MHTLSAALFILDGSTLHGHTHYATHRVLGVEECSDSTDSLTANERGHKSSSRLGAGSQEKMLQHVPWCGGSLIHFSCLIYHWEKIFLSHVLLNWTNLFCELCRNTTKCFRAFYFVQSQYAFVQHNWDFNACCMKTGFFFIQYSLYSFISVGLHQLRHLTL